MHMSTEAYVRMRMQTRVLQITNELLWLSICACPTAGAARDGDLPTSHTLPYTRGASELNSEPRPLAGESCGPNLISPWLHSCF